MPVVQHGSVPRVLLHRHLVGDGVQVARRRAQNLVVVNMQLAVVGRLDARRHRAHLAVQHQRSLEREHQRVVVLGQGPRRQDARQVPIAVLEGDEGGRLLHAQLMDAPKHLDAGALLARAVAQLDGLVAQLDPHGRRQRGVLGEHDLLGVLEVLGPVPALVLLLLGRGLLLGQFLLVGVDAADGLLHGALGGLLPRPGAVGALLGCGRSGEVGRGRLVEVLQQGMVEGLVGAGLGAVRAGVVFARGGVDVALCVRGRARARALGAVGEILRRGHFGSFGFTVDRRFWCFRAGEEGLWTAWTRARLLVGFNLGGEKVGGAIGTGGLGSVFGLVFGGRCPKQQ